MLICRSSSLFGLSKKPALYIDAGRALGADGVVASSVRNDVNAAVCTDSGNNPKVKYAGLNGRKTLNYDASKYTLHSATVAAGSVTLVAVTKRTSAAANWFFMEHGSDTASNNGCYMYEQGNGAMGFRQGAQTAFGVPNVMATWQASHATWYTRITRCDHGGQVFNTRLNGTNIATSNGVPSNWGTAGGHVSNFFLGRRGAGGLDFRGEVAIAVMYSGYLTDAECAIVEKVLRNRFKHY